MLSWDQSHEDTSGRLVRGRAREAHRRERERDERASVSRVESCERERDSCEPI